MKNRCSFCGTIRRGKKNLCPKKTCVNFGLPQKSSEDFVTLFNFEEVKKRSKKTDEEKVFLKLKKDMGKLVESEQAESFKIAVILFVRGYGLEDTACQLIDDFGLYDFFSQFDKNK